MEILVFGITVYPLVFQHPPNTLWRSVFGPPKGFLRRYLWVLGHLYSKGIWTTRDHQCDLQILLVHPGRLTEGTYKSPMKRKENDLNQTSRVEILHQLIGSLSHYLQGFIHPRWCRISSINSRDHHVISRYFWWRLACWACCAAACACACFACCAKSAAGVAWRFVRFNDDGLIEPMGKTPAKATSSWWTRAKKF